MLLSTLPSTELTSTSNFNIELILGSNLQLEKKSSKLAARGPRPAMHVQFAARIHCQFE